MFAQPALLLLISLPTPASPTTAVSAPHDQAKKLPSIAEVRRDNRFITEGIWSGTPLMLGGGLAGGLIGAGLASGLGNMGMLGRSQRSERELALVLMSAIAGSISGVLYGAGVPARRRGGECSLLARWLGMLPGLLTLGVPVLGLAGPSAGATWACRREFVRHEGPYHSIPLDAERAR